MAEKNGIRPEDGSALDLIVAISDKVITGETIEIRAKALLDLLKTMEVKTAKKGTHVLAAQVMAADNIAQAQGKLDTFCDCLESSLEKFKEQNRTLTITNTIPFVLSEMGLTGESKDSTNIQEVKKTNAAGK